MKQFRVNSQFRAYEAYAPVQIHAFLSGLWQYLSEVATACQIVGTVLFEANTLQCNDVSFCCLTLGFIWESLPQSQTQYRSDLIHAGI